MLKRIIPSLLLRQGRLIKGVAFDAHRDAGRPDTTARAYNAQGADELMLLDIDASRGGRCPDYESFASVARSCQMPLTVGGGIASVEIARRAMEAGADKLAVNAAALDDPRLIDALARLFGTQAVVVCIDVVMTDQGRMVWDYRVGRPRAGSWREWLVRAASEGAGEIRLMAVDREGGRGGLDIELHAEACGLVEVPIILEGGAGTLEHVAEAMRSGVDAIALGTMLVFSDNNITKVKSYLKNAGLEVRL